MRGSSWPALADLDPILGMFRRSGQPILGTLGASVGHVWGLAGGFWRLGRKKMVMLWKIKKCGKTQENARNVAKYWTVLCAGGSQIWGCAAAGGQSGLHGSIQGLNLTQSSPNIGPT